MNENGWIVCERAGGWAAALRVTVARQADGPALMPRLYEVRSLDELAARLETRTTSLGLIEVHAANLRPVLSWLAAARALFPAARFVALLDREICGPDVAESLLEAGAVEIADSPRRLQDVLTVARRHAAAWTTRRSSIADEQSLVAWARSLMPWQGDQPEVG